MFHARRPALERFGDVSGVVFLGIGNPNFTDADVPHFATLSNLEVLNIWGSLSQSGIAELQAALPNCEITVENYPPSNSDNGNAESPEK